MAVRYIIGTSNESYNPNPPNASANPNGALHKVDTLFAIDPATGNVDWAWTSPEGTTGIVPFLVAADGKVAIHYNEVGGIGRLAMIDSEGEESPLFEGSDGSDVGPQPWFGSGQFGGTIFSIDSFLSLLPDGSFALLAGTQTAQQTMSRAVSERFELAGNPQRQSRASCPDSEIDEIILQYANPIYQQFVATARRLCRGSFPPSEPSCNRDGRLQSLGFNRGER